MTNSRSFVSMAVLGSLCATVAACSGGNKTEGEPANTATAQAPVAAGSAEPGASDAPLTANAPSAGQSPVVYASLTGDAAKGATVFVKCKTCHVLEEGQNRIGPSLHGIIGRTAGQVPGFNYSAANKNSGLVWNEDVLFEYLEDPRKKVPGTKMVFVGLKAPQDRADVIAYLRENTK